MSDMNPKQKLFADQYVITKNATKSAILAGYSQKSAEWLGYQLLQKPPVSEYIKDRLQTVADKLGVTAGYVIGSFKKVADRSMQEEQVVDKEGKPTGEYIFNAAGANKALECLGKHLQLWDKDDKKPEGGITINIVQF